MEDADFAAGSDEEGDLIELYDGEEETEDEEAGEGEEYDEEMDMDELKKEWAALNNGKSLMDGDSEYESEGTLEDGELAELTADLDDDEDEDLEDEDLDLDEHEEMFSSDDGEEDVPVVAAKSSKKDKKGKKVAEPTVLEEPEFVPASTSKRAQPSKSVFEHEDMGDLTELSAAEQAERSAKKRSLRFHTSKIAATSARRNAAREARLQGDEDVPYKNRQAARDAALQRNSTKGAAGEDLDGEDWSEKDKKRAREAMDEDDGDDYYEQVKRRRTYEKEAKQQAHDDAREEQRWVRIVRCVLSFVTDLRGIPDEHSWHLRTRTAPEHLPERSRRIVVSPQGEPRPTETLVSKRGRVTRRPRERSSLCVLSTPEDRVRREEPIKEKRPVSPRQPSRGVSRWINVFDAIVLCSLVYTNPSSRLIVSITSACG